MLLWRLIFLVILHLAISHFIPAQQLKFQYEAGVTTIPPVGKVDSVFIIKLLDLGKYHLDKQGEYPADLDSAAAFFRKAIKLSDSLQIKNIQYEALCLLGISYFEKNNNQQGERYFMQAIEGYRLAGDKDKEADSWFRMGYYRNWVYANYPAILSNLNQALTIYRQTGNKAQEIRVFKEIADVHLNQGKLEEAEQELLQVIDMYQSIDYKNLHYTYDLLSVVARLKGDFNKGLQYAMNGVKSMEATGDSLDAPFFYSRVAHIYRDLGQIDKSIQWYQKELTAWRIRNYPHMYMYRDAGYLVQQLIKQNKKEEAYRTISELKKAYPPQGSFEKSSVAQALGYCYLAMEQYDQAEKYFLDMVEELQEVEAGETTSEAQHEIGKFYVERQQFEKARGYLTKAMDLPAGIANSARILDLHHLLFKVDSASGNYLSAIEHFRQHKILNDSLFNTTKSRQIEELQIAYEIAKKEQDIKLLKNESELQQNQLQQAKQVKNITLFGIFLLLIFVGLLYNQYRIKQKNNQEISKKNKTLQQLLNEKDWLLKEIHHRVKNNLQVVMSLMNSQSAYLENEDTQQAFRESRHRMQAMSLIHQKLYQSNHIDLIDINAYIRELVSFLQDSFGTAHHFIFELNVAHLQMDVSQATPLGLILNEAISNAIKYAFPGNTRGKVTISLSAPSEDQYQLVIADNGVGLLEAFDINLTNTLGMKLMQGLSKQLEGTFQYESCNGLRLIIQFPDKKIMESQFLAVGVAKPFSHE